jgi:hypothetical protein
VGRPACCSDGRLAGHARGPLTSLSLSPASEPRAVLTPSLQDDEAAAGEPRWSTGRHRAGCRVRRYEEEFLTADGGGSPNGIVASRFRTRVSSLYYLEDLQKRLSFFTGTFDLFGCCTFCLGWFL